MFILVPVVGSCLCAPVQNWVRANWSCVAPTLKCVPPVPLQMKLVALSLGLAFPPVTSVPCPGCPCFIPQEVGWQPCATLLVLRVFLTSGVKRAGVEKPSISGFHVMEVKYAFSTMFILQSFSPRIFTLIYLGQTHCSLSLLVTHCVTGGQGTHRFLLLDLDTFWGHKLRRRGESSGLLSGLSEFLEFTCKGDAPPFVFSGCLNLLL